MKIFLTHVESNCHWMSIKVLASPSVESFGGWKQCLTFATVEEEGVNSSVPFHKSDTMLLLAGLHI